MDYNIESPENVVSIGTTLALNVGIGTPKNYVDAVRSGQHNPDKSPIPVKDGKSKKTHFDDGNRRRSSRDANDDKAALDKAMDRAKFKNLEV